MIKKKYFYLLLLILATVTDTQSMGYATALKAASDTFLKKDYVSACCLQVDKKQEELKVLTDQYAKQHDSPSTEKAKATITANDGFALIDNKEEQVATAIFEVPDKSTLYALSEDEIIKAKELFQIQFAENKGTYKIVHFLYNDKNILPENKAQAIYLLYSPYLKNNETRYTANTLQANPLNEFQKKIICPKSNLPNNLQNEGQSKLAQLKSALSNKLSPKKEGFLGTTKIKTDKGFCKIEDIKVGDLVACYDEKNKTQTYSKITHVNKARLAKHLQIKIDDEIIQVAPDHQFYVPYTEAWISASDLKDNPDFRKFIDPNIKAIKEVHEALDVVRITVDKEHNFYITDKNILVHNSIPVVIELMIKFGEGVAVSWEVLAPSLAAGSIAFMAWMDGKYSSKNGIFNPDISGMTQKVVPMSPADQALFNANFPQFAPPGYFAAATNNSKQYVAPQPVHNTEQETSFEKNNKNPQPQTQPINQKDQKNGMSGGAPQPNQDPEKDKDKNEGHQIKINDKHGQDKHIFRNENGHLPDTPENRKLLIDTASNTKNRLGVDQNGTEWFGKTLDNGKQVWATVRNNLIRNGGVNDTPKIFNPKTGLCKTIGK